jgi:hypothetical protein
MDRQQAAQHNRLFNMMMFVQSKEEDKKSIEKNKNLSLLQ